MIVSFGYGADDGSVASFGYGTGVVTEVPPEPPVTVFPALGGQTRLRRIPALVGSGRAFGRPGIARGRGRVILAARGAAPTRPSIVAGVAVQAILASGTALSSRAPETRAAAAIVARGRRISEASGRLGSVRGIAGVALRGSGTTTSTPACIQATATQRAAAIGAGETRTRALGQAETRYQALGAVRSAAPNTRGMAARLIRAQCSGVASVRGGRSAAHAEASNVQLLVIRGTAGIGSGAVTARARRTFRDDPAELALLGLVEV